MDVIKDFIRPELLVLIPVLYWFGVALKRTERFSDRWIPLTLGVIGMVLASIYVAATGQSGSFLMTIFTGITQGILCAAGAVYANQVVKQAGEPK